MLFPSEKITIELPKASLEYFPNFFDLQKANELFSLLQNTIPWQQDTITVFGKNHLQPRLTALYGNNNNLYQYSNVVMKPHPWNSLLTFIKEAIEDELHNTFNAVLLNYYRNGADSMGWHADNEASLGRNPIIASVSFGATRPIQFKHNTLENLKHKINLEHGSLLVMKGETQHFWKHQIPKTSKPVGPRINLTFRNLL
ncbi:alkylated DNA repair dioxygenase AlkB [Flavobacterium croceum DSM 17960]|uniref:Alkylated DNA repair dioxygenase AlkB n=1 Tax=Flavobacterium croceum DSM 17960 TaxID=1121886 RepID=A0A2S4N6K6_9FLAO|nr:alpha-ketoglutarate-dependent dioxygenase AlkB [Flavobacterium croceum]POS01345.1 alkylated DNA repair dioxygenase AlkB [Flavobacterium croceum DSM 17960]